MNGSGPPFQVIPAPHSTRAPSPLLDIAIGRGTRNRTTNRASDDAEHPESEPRFGVQLPFRDLELHEGQGT